MMKSWANRGTLHGGAHVGVPQLASTKRTLIRKGANLLPRISVRWRTQLGVQEAGGGLGGRSEAHLGGQGLLGQHKMLLSTVKMQQKRPMKR